MQNWRFAMPAALIAASALMAACEQSDGRFEQAGENVDQAVEKAGDKIEDATDN